MNRPPQESHNPGFFFGLLTGSAIGAGLVMYCDPKISSEIRKRVVASAKDLGDTASEYCDQVSTRVVDAVAELGSGGQKGRGAADVVARGADQVARGAYEVERFADAAATGAGKH